MIDPIFVLLHCQLPSSNMIQLSSEVNVRMFMALSLMKTLFYFKQTARHSLFHMYFIKDHIRVAHVMVNPISKHLFTLLQVFPSLSIDKETYTFVYSMCLKIIYLSLNTPYTL